MKTNRSSRRYVLSLLLWMVCMAWASAGRTDLHNVKVGYYSIPGYHNLSETGERSGYGYDFLQLVRRFTQVEFSYTGYDKSWEESLAMLSKGEIDLLTGALRTPEREKVFDFSFPIGQTSLNLYVRSREVRYKPLDYATYNGMRIGTVESEMLDDRIQRLAARNHFRCTIVPFQDFESMYKAMDSQQIDAMCDIALHLISGYRVLESFDEESIYAIVRKGNQKLLGLLNDAILQMDQSIAMWSLQLFQSNYLINTDMKLEFTEEEQAFIRQHSTPETAIKVATDDNWAPYSWFADGRYQGIVVDILDNLMKRAGLAYEFVQDSASSERVLQEHPEADVYTCFAGTEQYAENSHLVASPSFLLPSIAILSQKHFGQLKTMGLTCNTPMLNKIAMMRFDYEFVVYPSTDELLEAVRTGRVDGAMLYDYVAQKCINSVEDKKLQINFVPGMVLPLHMVTRMEDGREIITILSKCISQMGRNERNNITTKYLSSAEREKNVWDFMKEHPWLPLLVLLVSISGFLFEKVRSLKILQRKDAQALRLAESANSAKTAFLFNMSHDIRTPMNAIIGFRDLLEKNQDDPERRADYLHKIQDASTVLLSIINNVLEMARIEKGTIKLDETAWSIQQFSDIICSIFKAMMEKKGLRFSCQINTQHPYFYCDPIKLREVFINILSNAYKYTSEGEVSMQIDELPSEREGWLCYQTTIRDTGMGMSQEFLPHLFEEFSREQNTTDAKIEGTGLGMPIVKRLVALMGGTIDVQSQKGVGTTFTVTIPHRIAERDSLVPVVGTTVDPSNFEGRRILLAEDNELNAEIAMEILGEKGFVTEHAENGQVCCDMLREAPDGYYDLILMDIQMPQMNGYEAASCIRSMEDPCKAGIPIIAMTANAFEEDKREALRMGMNGHLAKPIDVHELMKTLSGIIGG